MEWLTTNRFATLPAIMAASSIPRPESNEAISARLVLLRRAYSVAQGHTREMSQSEFARTCGIGVQAWWNAENGYRIGLSNAMKVRTRTGAGLDFIYYDNRTVLPHAIALAIDKIERAEKPPRAKRA